jgi:hypothetical protein
MALERAGSTRSASSRADGRLLASVEAADPAGLGRFLGRLGRAPEADRLVAQWGRPKRPPGGMTWVRRVPASASSGTRYRILGRGTWVAQGPSSASQSLVVGRARSAAEMGSVWVAASVDLAHILSKGPDRVAVRLRRL